MGANAVEVVMLTNILTEMTKGNFSFLILIVGILQLVVMITKKRH